MSAESRECDAVRADAAEFVLGTLDGVARARIVEHIATCARCREEIATLADTVNDLGVLAPDLRPSVGFADRVLAIGLVEAAGRTDVDGLAATPAIDAAVPGAEVVDLDLRRAADRHRRRPWLVTLAAAAVIVALVIGLAVRGGRESSGSTAFVAMVAPDGDVIGTSAAAGPDAVAVTVDYPSNWLDYRLEAVHNDGSATTLGSMAFIDGAWRWSGDLPEADSVARLRVVRPDGKVTCWSRVPR